MGGINSFTNIGLLSRETEAELGRIVQLGLAIERSLQAEAETLGRELTGSEEAELLQVP